MLTGQLQQNYVTYTYTPNGKGASVTDANGNRAEMRYDGHDRQNRWVFLPRRRPGRSTRVTSRVTRSMTLAIVSR